MVLLSTIVALLFFTVAFWLDRLVLGQRPANAAGDL